MLKKHITFVRGARPGKDWIYRFMRWYGRFIYPLMVKRVVINGMEHLPGDKPVLLASTHFNSFFDSILTHLILRPKVYALARGDAFNKPKVSAFLEILYILPIWRISEGKENMVLNEHTFDRCHEVFQEGDKVLIYPEGICKNQIEVLPLKKGTASMALRAWREDLDVYVIPLTINYDDYRRIGKRINFNLGKAFRASDFNLNDEKQFVTDFNQKLYEGMAAGVDREFKSYSFFKNPLWPVFWVLCFPLYFGIQAFVQKKFSRTVFHDSIWFGFLYAVLPLYLLILAGVLAVLL